jgi:hypothetical protein
VLVAAGTHAATVIREAQGALDRLLADADEYVERKLAESIRLLTDAADYVDRKLAELQVVLGQLGLQVNNGRLRLTARREAELARFQGTEPAGEHHRRTGARRQPPASEPEGHGPAAAGARSELVDPAFG